jgi:hypothetical protein
MLGEPAVVEFTAQTSRIRTNLLIVASVSIALAGAGLHIDSSSTILGLRFAELSDEIVRRALLLVIAYLMLHFVWSALAEGREACTVKLARMRSE